MGEGCERLTIFMQSRVPLGPSKFHIVVLVSDKTLMCLVLKIYSFSVLHLPIKCLVTKLRTNRNVHQVLSYVNSIEKWTGM